MTDDANSKIDDANAVLRITSPSLSADEISKRLDLRPDRARSKGDAVGPGIPGHARHPRTVWTRSLVPPVVTSVVTSVTAGRTDDPLVERALEVLTRSSAGLATLGEASVTLVLGFVPDDEHSFELSLARGSLARAAALGVDIVLHVQHGVPVREVVYAPPVEGEAPPVEGEAPSVEDETPAVEGDVPKEGVAHRDGFAVEAFLS